MQTNFSRYYFPLRRPLPSLFFTPFLSYYFSHFPRMETYGLLFLSLQLICGWPINLITYRRKFTKLTKFNIKLNEMKRISNTRLISLKCSLHFQIFCIYYYQRVIVTNLAKNRLISFSKPRILSTIIFPRVNVCCLSFVAAVYVIL